MTDRSFAPAQPQPRQFAKVGSFRRAGSVKTLKRVESFKRQGSLSKSPVQEQESPLHPSHMGRRGHRASIEISIIEAAHSDHDIDADLSVESVLSSDEAKSYLETSVLEAKERDVRLNTALKLAQLRDVMDEDAKASKRRNPHISRPQTAQTMRSARTWQGKEGFLTSRIQEVNQVAERGKFQGHPSRSNATSAKPSSRTSTADSDAVRSRQTTAPAARQGLVTPGDPMGNPKQGLFDDELSKLLSGAEAEDQMVLDEARAESPTTQEAMKRLGVDEEELVFLPLEHFEAQFESEGSQNARLAGIRFEHNEQCRQVLVASVLAERSRIASLAAALAGTDEGDLQRVFVRFSAAGKGLEQQQGGRRGLMDFNEWQELLFATALLPSKVSIDDAAEVFVRAAGGRGGQLEFGEFRASLQRILKTVHQREEESQRELLGFGRSVAEKVARKKAALEHVSKLENKRLTLQFAREMEERDEVLESIAKHARVDEALQAKLAQRRAEAAQKRRDEHDRHQALVEANQQRREGQAAERAQHLRNKQQRKAEQRAVRLQHKRDEAEVAAEMLRLRNQQVVARRARHERAHAHREVELCQVMAAKAQRKTLLHDQQRELQRKRHRLALEWAWKHKELKEVRKDFAWTGEVRKIPPALKQFDALHYFKNPPLPQYLEDLDEGGAIELTLSETAHEVQPEPGVVGANEYVDYKVFVPPDMGRCTLRIHLKALEGDSDVFVGNGMTPKPRRKDGEHTWGKESWGDEKLSIHYWDPAFNFGWYYISVRGSRAGYEGWCKFLISTYARPVADVQERYRLDKVA